MTQQAFDKIKDGLEDAIAIAEGYLANEPANLRKMLLGIYTSGILCRDVVVREDVLSSVLDSVLAAAEGRQFKPLPVPLPVEANAEPASTGKPSP